MADEDDDEYLNTVEAAKLLKSSPRTLEGFRVDGTGPPFFKVGPGRKANVLYRRHDLKAWLEKFKFEPTSEYPKRGKPNIPARPDDK